MGLREFLARRRMEARIRKQGKRLFSQPKRRASTEKLTKGLVSVSRRGRRVAERLYLETQLRKGKGKEIVKRQIKKLLVGTGRGTRTLLRGEEKRRR